MDGGSLARVCQRRGAGRKALAPGAPVQATTTTTISTGDIASRIDTCRGDAIRVLTVSRIDPRKGLRVLPEVVAALARRGINASLDIVGPAVGRPGEDERRSSSAMPTSAAVGEHVRLLGPVPLDQLLPLYRNYDLFVLPTLPGEGIPRVLLEAMTAGVPIVTTQVAGIPSLIEDEVNGLLVAAPTVDAVTGASARLVTMVGAPLAADCQRLRNGARIHARSASGARCWRKSARDCRSPEAAPRWWRVEPIANLFRAAVAEWRRRRARGGAHPERPVAGSLGTIDVPVQQDGPVSGRTRSVDRSSPAPSGERAMGAVASVARVRRGGPGRRWWCRS